MSHDLNISDTLLAGIDSGRMLPGNWYTDPEITERELQQVFAKSWAYVGPANEVRNIGDFITGYIGGGNDRRGERVEEYRRLHHGIYWRANPRRSGARFGRAERAGQYLSPSPARSHERSRQCQSLA